MGDECRGIGMLKKLNWLDHQPGKNEDQQGERRRSGRKMGKKSRKKGLSVITYVVNAEKLSQPPELF